MAQSHSNLLVHLIFSTRHRVPSLTPEVQPGLHRYLLTVLRNHDCVPVQAGGATDHVHLLFALARTVSMAEIVETLKTSSSKWLKTQAATLSEFHWQSGYGAFSVSQSEAERVAGYIQGQEEHHKKVSFQEEYRKFLDRYKVEYKEEYLWIEGGRIAPLQGAGTPPGPPTQPVGLG